MINSSSVGGRIEERKQVKKNRIYCVSAPLKQDTRILCGNRSQSENVCLFEEPKMLKSLQGF